MAFGGRWSGTQASDLDTDLALEIPAGSRVLRFRGRVDRIDYTPGSGFRVIDYKTGKGSMLPRDGQLRGGQALQLPIYLRAGELILGIPAASGEAAYHVVSRAGQFKRVTFTGAALESAGNGLDLVLARIADGVATGDFHPEPDAQRACRYCDFDGLCDVGRARQHQRKREDPRAMSFADMRDVE